MTRRPRSWLIAAVAVLALVLFYRWHAATRIHSVLGGSPSGRAAALTNPPSQLVRSSPPSGKSLPGGPAKTHNPLVYRLSNTSLTIGLLARQPDAILLENALWSTKRPVQPAIPDHLHAQGDPKSYIVQSRKALDRNFHDMLKQAGADIVSYIPNNAYLIRGSAEVARRAEANPRTQ